jgi:hypothetical protein
MIPPHEATTIRHLLARCSSGTLVEPTRQA